MTGETHVHAARRAVDDEIDAVSAKIDAIETFLRRVADLPVDAGGTGAARTRSSSATAGTGGTAVRMETRAQSDPPARDGCEAVRTAFADTIYPHSTPDLDRSESVLEAIRAEFTDEVAIALAPTTATSLTSDLKRIVRKEADRRRRKALVMRRTLGRELDLLDQSIETVEEISDWIVTADETPLTDVGFDELLSRHDTLDAYRERCGSLSRERQAFLRETTSRSADVGLRHRQLVPYLYEEFPVDHPILVTVARLERTCCECQRAIRSHVVSLA